MVISLLSLIRSVHIVLYVLVSADYGVAYPIINFSDAYDDVLLQNVASAILLF